MISNDFQDGFISYESGLEETETLSFLDETPWDDGYLAFSRGEIRWRGRKGQPLPDLTDGRVNEKLSDVQGYLMEAGLWRSPKEGVFEEISIEREDRGFFLQKWVLETEPAQPKIINCHYRKAMTLSGGGHSQGAAIFNGNDLHSIEVVMPEARLHFFITTGGK